MRHPKLVTAIIALSLCALWSIDSGRAAFALTAPQQTITIAGKKPVQFNHQLHLKLGLDCGVCHHDAKHQARSVKDIAALTDPAVLHCATCHNDSFANPHLRRAMDVFHARCRECHKAGINGKKGPTNCTACHTKQRKAIEGC